MEKKLSRIEKEKISRKEYIIDSAEKLFFKNGFENVSMDIIAKESEFTKSTIYKYFPSKEDLYFAVALNGYKKLFLCFQKNNRSGTNGYENIFFSLKAYYKFYKEYPECFRVISSIGFIKSNGEISHDNLQEWQNIDNQIFSEIIKLIEKGKKDGSILDFIDSKKTTYSIIFIITGFFNLFAETGNNFINYISLDEKDFINYTLDLIANTIKKK